MASLRRDCHGDLHLEHIHLAPDSIHIFDCIEFNDRFRFLDVANDLAFLAMDLDFEFGRLKGPRIVRGREVECEEHYHTIGQLPSMPLNLISTLPEE